MTTFADIKEALPTLTPGQLGELRVLLDVLHTPSDTAAAEPDSDASMFYGALTWYLGKVAPVEVFPWPMYLKRHGSAKTYKSKFKTVQSFVDTKLKGLSKTQRRGAYFTLARLLIAYLTRKKLGLSLNVVVNHMGIIPALFETSFPGYIEAGLASQVIDRTELPD